MDTGVPEDIFVASWNLAGLAEGDVDVFLAQLSDNYVWDIICLQEAFTRGEGIEFNGPYELFTSGEVGQHQRCPAILVNSATAGAVRFLGSHARWVAVELKNGSTCVSLHLPHPGHGMQHFVDTLQTLDDFLLTRRGQRVFIGMDANVRLDSVVDHWHVGEGVVCSSPDHANSQKALILLEFLAKYGLYMVNTFTDGPIAERFTRYAWDNTSASQIDYLAVPVTSRCADVGVDQCLHFRSDHRMVWAVVGESLPRVADNNLRTPRNWTPNASWNVAASGISWNWWDWESTVGIWQQTAVSHTKRAQRNYDDVLGGLLHDFRFADASNRRTLNRSIWRRRRFLRRLRAKQAVREAAERGCLPNSAPKNATVNWHKLCGGRDAREFIFEYFSNVYSLEVEELCEEVECKTYWIDTWRSLRIDLHSFHVTPALLRRMIRKLKNGKSSPDGCTAELYKHLPDAALESMALFFSDVFAKLDFHYAWTVVGATLIPKIVAPANLGQFRAIACLSVARKLVGYFVMHMLPTLRYDSFQCGFVKGAHAANGVYVIKKAIELSKEWKVPLCIAQLDLRKAFDRVLHSAVLKALRLQGVSLQCIAIVSALLNNSKTSVSLGKVTSARITMERGLPQGAPESPVLFTLVTELVLRPLLARWQQRHSGWEFADFVLSAILYADDVILLSSSRKDLELMISEVIAGFSVVGLETSTEKSHWTSHPSKPGSRLRFGQDRISWEQSITFVGTVLELSEHDAPAITHRLAQATKVFFKWKPVLLNRSASMRCRVQLTINTVFACLLWLAETWKPTQRQQRMLNSWAARTVGKVMCVHRRADEDAIEHWRRLHRTGHEMLRSHGGSLGTQRRRRLHSFAGHIARSTEGLAGQALRTRPMSWWRFFQANKLMLHDGRFFAWRWEEQLEAFYGRASSCFVDEAVGWMAVAQNRDVWRQSADAFSCA